jgi:hypothetical protein
MILSLASRVVMVGLVPAIQPSARSIAGGNLDPRHKPEDDSEKHLLEPEH